jgi:hypothetical protein
LADCWLMLAEAKEKLSFDAGNEGAFNFRIASNKFFIHALKMTKYMFMYASSF